VRKRWESLVRTPDGLGRRYYELCVLSELKNALRSGDIWVQGSRQFKDYLLPPLRNATKASWAWRSRLTASATWNHGWPFCKTNWQPWSGWPPPMSCRMQPSPLPASSRLACSTTRCRIQRKR
jgi:hypothetical protein